MPLITNTKVLPPIVVTLVVLIIVAMFAFKPAPPIKEDERATALVDVIRATPGDLSPTLTLFGRVESPFVTTLSASSAAFVEQVMAFEGQSVKRGDLLVMLDQTDLKLQLAQRQAELDDIDSQIAQLNNQHKANQAALAIDEQLLTLADKAANRYENLVQKNVGSDIQRDDALQSAKRQALNVTSRRLAVVDYPNQLKRLQAQQAKIKALRDQVALELTRTRITAPFNGQVTKVFVSPRNRLRQGDQILSLFNSDRIEIRAQVPARYLSKLRTAIASGQQLTAQIKQGTTVLHLKLSRLAGNISESKGGVDAFFEFSDNRTPLAIGLAVELNVQLPHEKNSVALPTTALYGQHTIYQINQENRLQAIAIERLGETLTATGEPWILVKGDIVEGTKILTTQLPNAISGLEVSVAKDDNHQ
ncbi:MAG: HlyD family efflux transporter periplasmic adaptor subunit [Pseudomonadales bacterium]|nr:HlyD family efflux transporter periplasmic adaptor subunit [Pseudomonadales bacterium]